MDELERDVSKITYDTLPQLQRDLAELIGLDNYITLVRHINSSLQKSTRASLSVSRDDMACAKAVETYLVFAGGYSSSGNYASAIDAYNVSLQRSTPTALSQAR